MLSCISPTEGEVNYSLGGDVENSHVKVRSVLENHVSAQFDF